MPDIPLIRPAGRERRATFFELFFDLVYVFAVTQLSHHLIASQLSWQSAIETTFMLIAVYWAWNYTTWMANWFDPDTVPVRLVLVFVMLASLLMAVAIPEGFGERALLFASAYVGLQVVRNAFVVAVTPRGLFNHNFRQILAWSVLSAPLWIVGGLVDDLRWPLWVLALGLDLVAPFARYWLPRLGRTEMSQWQISGDHFAERFQLFVIIALGESIVLTGVTASATELDTPVVIALCLAFLASTALWWLYFSGTARVLAERIAGSGLEEAGLLGRDVYTYLHVPVVAGIVMAAVGDELVLAHPGEPLGLRGALVTLGGPALYLLGLVACRARVRGGVAAPYVVTALVLLAGVPVAARVAGLAGLAFVVLVLVALAGVEHVQRGRPVQASSQ
ncbi:low temperature requirement protein A [Flindersiella endophytica]